MMNNENRTILALIASPRKLGNCEFQLQYADEGEWV